MEWVNCDKFKIFEDKNTFNIIVQAFQLLISDVDMSSNDDTVFDRVYDEICNTKCVSSIDCKECLKKYYIERAINKLKQEGEIND